MGGPTRGKEDADNAQRDESQHLGLAWTVAYYVVLVAGAIVWWQALWPLTESGNALVEIRREVGAQAKQLNPGDHERSLLGVHV